MAVSFSLVCSAQGSTSGIADTAQYTPGSMGWAPFTMADKRALDLSDSQMSRLREMDNGFSERYKGMGIEPWRNKEFPALNRQRNHAIRDILGDRQYERWATPSTPVPADAPTIIPDSTSPQPK